MMKQLPVSEIGLRRLAEGHVEAAVERLGKLVRDPDSRIGLEASQLILRLARPHSIGVWELPPRPGGWDWTTPWDEDDPWGGLRAG